MKINKAFFDWIQKNADKETLGAYRWKHQVNRFEVVSFFKGTEIMPYDVDIKRASEIAVSEALLKN